jgi:hypothetical protein
MIPSRRQACHEKPAAFCWPASRLGLFLSVGLAVVSLPVWGQVPTSSREELMRKWDVNRDGKVDAGEAEIARGRMRRARTEAIINSGNDPVTGKPRVVTDPVTGQPVPSAAADRGGLSEPDNDDGLILVPGNGEVPGVTGGAAGIVTRSQDTPPQLLPQERAGLPGTRVPSMLPTTPSVAPRLPGSGSAIDPGSRASGVPGATGRQGAANARESGGDELSSRARMLPGMSPQQTPGGRDPRSLGSVPERQPPGARPGIISGGTRAGIPGARPGYGMGGPPGDLNAGRLPGGLPQTRGVAPGTVAGPRIGPMQQSNAGRLAGPDPSVPRPAIGPYRGATAPMSPSVGVPSVPQPGVRRPDGGRPTPRAPSTVPRTPRMSTDDFYGR